MIADPRLTLESNSKQLHKDMSRVIKVFSLIYLILDPITSIRDWWAALTDRSTAKGESN